MNVVESIKSIFKKPLVKVFLAFLLLTFIASILVLNFERKTNPSEYTSFWDSIWWALVTVFTVGYGDIRPITFGGRIVAIVVMFAGISLLSLITATISSIFVSKKIREDQGLESIKYENHIIICGWNNHAESIIDTIFLLSKQKQPKIILVNELPEREINTILDKFRKNKVKFIRGDYTRNAPLERANIKDANAVILLPDLSQVDFSSADDKTLLATLNIKSSHSKLKVIAFIMNQENEIHIKRAKADEVFISDQFADFIIASNVMEPGLTDVLSEILNPKGGNAISSLPIPPKFKGRKYEELFQYFKTQHNFLLLGVVSEVESIGVSDFLSADTSHLDAFIEKKLKEAGKGLGEENKVIVNLNPDDDYIIQENETAIVLK